MNHHDIIGGNGIFVDFYHIGAVFFRIFFLNGFGWQFSRFAQWHESSVEIHSKHSATDESAGFNTHHLGDAFVLVEVVQTLAHNLKRFGIFEGCGKVFELNARYWEIRNVANYAFHFVKLFLFHCCV